MHRRCCCSCRSKSFPSASDWVADPGGSVSVGTEADTLDIDGDVNPSSFLSTEAWLIEFVLEAGSVTITIDSVDYVIDADTQSMTANGNSVDFGWDSLTNKLTNVELRVTPTHAFLLVFGNYSASTGRTYGILTVDRSTDVPSSFACEWDSAILRGFTISDSTVTVSEDGYSGPVFSVNCWARADVEVCPYIVAYDETNDHQYYGTTNVVQESNFDSNIRSVSGDMDMANVSLNIGSNAWFDGSDGRTYGTPFWAFRVTSAIGDTRLSSPSNGTLDYRRGEAVCAGLSEIACWRSPGSGSWNDETLHLNFNLFVTSVCSRQLTLTWYTPTVANPYPKPYLYAQLAMGYSQGSYESGGTTDAEIEPNDIPSGFALTVVGTENQSPANSYQFKVGGTWTVL